MPRKRFASSIIAAVMAALSWNIQVASAGTGVMMKTKDVGVSYLHTISPIRANNAVN
jgi:hypothetical protein